jgi:DNA-binding PadR family transcriptional regulator
MLDLLILRTLRQGELNGWDIMNRIQIVSGEVLRVIPGSLYPALHRLEAGGLVKANGELLKTIGARSSTS